MTAVLLLVGSLVGCGPTCYSSCQKLYGDEPNCAIWRGGRSATELIDTCLDACEGALEVPGEVGNYDPYTAAGSNISVELENEKQAAVWMECVDAQACERLESGYCAPVW